MEELESKLNLRNPVIIAQIFSRIIQTIKDKDKSAIKESPELKFLKDKCMLPDNLISEVAGTGIINLVENGILQIETTLPDFITAIPLTKCYSSLINIIGSLLYLEIKNNRRTNNKFKSVYNLWLPQHPYITILIENSSSWNKILSQIRYLYNRENTIHITELFTPLYLYILCNPLQNSHTLFKERLWGIVLSKSNDSVFYNILGWMQVETKNNLEANCELLNEAFVHCASKEKHVFNLEILILWQASVLHNLALNEIDIRPCIDSLTNVLAEIKEPGIINCLLLMLAKTIVICSSVYLLDLLNLCQMLLSYDGIEIYILHTVKASLLEWLANTSLLTAEADKVANNIFLYIENYKILPTKYELLKTFSIEFHSVLSTNSDVFISLEITLLLEHFKEETNVLQWLERIGNTPDCLFKNTYHFLCGLFLNKNFSPAVSIKILSLMLKNVEQNKLLTTQLLTLILYKLSNTTDSKLHFALLKALPKMVVLKENIPKIMATIQALSKGSVDLYNFSLSLLYDTWKINLKCYSYLESMLIQNKVAIKKWESYVTRTYILKELCDQKPELYGKDMVPHLSRILNECNDDDGSLPCALAIEGIIALCKNEIIDVITTWATLSPKYKNDMRIPVIISLCSLIYEIPHLPYTESYTELNNEVVKALWDYVKVGDPEITRAALNALTSFTLEQICSQMPENYFDENVLQERQKSVVGTPNTVPGDCWVKFLKEHRASTEAGDFLIKMVSIEVAGYLKHIYQVKGHREPVNYDYLPTHSIIRGIGRFIKTKASKWNIDALYIECLRIFATEYSKPLPPLDWCFLQELLHESATKDLCVDIASHQAMLSGTARRLMENYVQAVAEDPQENDVLNVVRNLKHLANSIQPSVLKPFFENTIRFAINKCNNNYDDKLLRKVSEGLKEVLQNEGIQETNKKTIAQVLTDIIIIISINSEVFGILLQCVTALPTKLIEEITTLKSDVSEDWLQKVIKIRCSLAIQTRTAPLNWLTNIIEVTSTLRRNDFTFIEFSAVFKKHINNAAECALWLLDLMGHMQAKVAERCAEKEVVYYFDVFILAVVEFSGFSTFILNKDDDIDSDQRMKGYFPQAFNALMKENPWSVCTNQALEWLYYMNIEESVRNEYRNIFGITLQSLRHDDEFIKNTKWMKYLSSNVFSGIND